MLSAAGVLPMMNFRAFAVIAVVAYLAGPVAAQVIDQGSDEKKKGDTTVKGSYSIVKDGNNVKIQIDFSVKKTGITGTGKGVVGFVLLDSEGKEVFKHEKGFTVGADLSGAVKKEDTKKITIFGDKWDKVVGVALNVTVESDTIGIPTKPEEWKEALGKAVPHILGGLEVGKKTDLKGWIIKRIK
jgi:hypothetical protein